jgi:hypothetical protein
MSLIPAEDLGYLDVVGEAFLAVRGQGLVLSPVDVELVRKYEAAGIPANALVHGIVRAAERRRAHGKPPPRSLSALKRTLDAEARRHQGGQVRAGALASAEAIDILLAAAREAVLPEERAAYWAAYRATCAGQTPVEAAALGWLTAVPRDLQRAVAQGVREAVGPRLAPEPREEYRGRLRRALVEDALERAELRI